MSHRARVRAMMQGFGQTTPDALTMPTIHDRKRMCNLLLEEVFEFVDACGLSVIVTSSDREHVSINLDATAAPRFIDMVDGMADISVVLHGATNGCGISDWAWERILEEVDNNNLLKIQNGHLDPASGKFIKPKDHPKPNLVDILMAQNTEILNATATDTSRYT